jgi:hypothetical protein
VRLYSVNKNSNRTAKRVVLALARSTISFPIANASESALKKLLGIYERAGSLEALRNIHSSEMFGSIEGFNLYGTVRSVALAPNKYAQTTIMEPLIQIQKIDGEQGWVIDQNSSVTELSGFELEVAITGAYLGMNRFLTENADGAEVEYLGPVEVEGRGCHSFQVSPLDGVQATIEIDSLTGDLVRNTLYLDEIELVTVTSDFRIVEGVRVGFKA